MVHALPDGGNGKVVLLTLEGFMMCHAVSCAGTGVLLVVVEPGSVTTAAVDHAEGLQGETMP